MRQLEDIEQGDVPFSTLDAPDVVSVQAGYFGEFFLGHSAIQPQFADAVAKEDSRVTSSHLIVRLTATPGMVYTL